MPLCLYDVGEPDTTKRGWKLSYDRGVIHLAYSSSSERNCERSSLNRSTSECLKKTFLIPRRYFLIRPASAYRSSVLREIPKRAQDVRAAIKETLVRDNLLALPHRVKAQARAEGTLAQLYAQYHVSSLDECMEWVQTDEVEEPARPASPASPGGTST